MAREDFGALDDQALVAKLEERHHALVRGQFALSMNRLENTATLRGLRADIARVETELRKRERDAGLAKNALKTKHRGSGPKGSSAAEGASAGFLANVLDGTAG